MSGLESDDSLHEHSTHTHDSDYDILEYNIDGENISTYNIKYWMYLALGIFIVIPNVFIIIVVIMKRLLSLDNKFIFILIMSFTDVLMGIASFTNTAFLSGDMIPVGNALAVKMTSIVIMIENTSQIATVLSVLGLTIDQYIRIAYPLKYWTIVTRRRIIIYCLVCFAITVFDTIALSVVILDWFKGELTEENANTFSIQQHIVRVIHFLLPLCIIILVHLKVLHIAYRHRKQINIQLQTVNGHPHTSSTDTNHKKGIRFVTFIIISLVMCWLPKCMFEMYLDIAGYVIPTLDDVIVFEALNILYMAHSSINPFLYAFRITQIREVITKTRCCCTGNTLN